VLKRRVSVLLCSLCLLSFFWIARAQAQVQGGGWSEPIRLSSEAGKASEGYLVADQYGYVHSFWIETLYKNQRRIIKYARFDGEAWSIPNDIYVTDLAITNVSPVVDQQGTLHLAWAEGFQGPAYYTHAPASSALSAQNWAQPIQIDIPAKTLILRVDSKNVFHILYTNQVEEPGVYYVSSKDRGTTWSDPVWLDPDILPNHVPDSLNFEIDETDGLHAVWVYGALDQNSRPDWVRYIHSLDGGNIWSTPFMIDQYMQESEHNLTFAGPKMVVAGQTVHVVWAAGSLPYRYHRFSTDAGQTWSGPRRLFGDLHGQAFDGLAVDRAGRVHFIGQIRYPQGIYHAYWDQNQWTPPSLIYLISQDGSEAGMGNRVHAHHTHPVVRAGNQLVLTFADGPADPNRRLFAMHRTLDDLLPLEPVPLPTLAATPVLKSGKLIGLDANKPTAMTQSSSPNPADTQAFSQTPRPDNAIIYALFPTLLLLGGFAFIRLMLKRGR